MLVHRVPFSPSAQALYFLKDRDKYLNPLRREHSTEHQSGVKLKSMELVSSSSH